MILLPKRCILLWVTAVAHIFIIGEVIYGEGFKMNRIKSYARFLEVFLLGGILLIIGSFIFKWFSGDIPIYCDIADSTKHTRLYAGLGYFYTTSHAPAPSLLIRLLACLVDGISIALFVWGCLCFLKLLRYYRARELFSSNTLALYTKLSRIAFAWTLYNPLKFTLLSFITTINNPHGTRVIAFGFNSDDIFYIFIVGFFLVITSLMQVAYELKHEHDLTV